MDRSKQYPGAVRADPRLAAAQLVQAQAQAQAQAPQRQLPVLDDQAGMLARLKLDYMKSFQDDPHFFPEMQDISAAVSAAAVAAQHQAHSPAHGFTNIQLQQHQQLPQGQVHPGLARSASPAGQSYLPQRSSHKLSDRENLLSLLAQKSFEKQQQQLQHPKQQGQFQQQHKRVGSPHYHQHQQQGDPYLVN